MKKRKGWIHYYLITIISVLLIINWGSRAVTVIAENTPIERKHCIIIDPGHGGVDGGATSCTGILESTLNLEISLRLNDLFHLLGFDTRIIRTGDISVYTKGETIAQKKISDLKERVRIVNETENAILVSIHQNNFSDSRYSGAQIFYSSTAQSKQLAEQLQTAFKETINQGSNRMCKKSNGIYLMEHINKPGILIECGFLSNPEEESKLKRPEYQKQLSCVVAATISSFLSNT